MVPGGWACILRCWIGQANSPVDPWAEKVLSGNSIWTEANRMELVAILEGLLALKEPCVVQVFSDSQNAIRWIAGTQKTNVREIAELVSRINRTGHSLMFEKIDAHSGVSLNERVDRLAKAEARKAELWLREQAY
jgi:ribonuclease HI